MMSEVYMVLIFMVFTIAAGLLGYCVMQLFYLFKDARKAVPPTNPQDDTTHGLGYLQNRCLQSTQAAEEVEFYVEQSKTLEKIIGKIAEFNDEILSIKNICMTRNVYEEYFPVQIRRKEGFVKILGIELKVFQSFELLWFYVFSQPGHRFIIFQEENGNLVMKVTNFPMQSEKTTPLYWG